MENAVDALKIAFAVFVFVIAITVTFNFISQAKTTGDTVLYYADDTNFYAYSASSDKNREVSVSEVISTLYRYYKESVSVTVDLKNNRGSKTFDLTGSNVNMKEIEKELETYIKDNLLTLNEDKKFIEEFVQVPISGIYVIGEDDTTVARANGENKVYVKYTLK